MQSREGVSFMEIERKYLLDQLPENLTSYPCKKIEQGYLSTEPVVRIRRSDDEYYLTYKSKGLMVREEYNLPLTKESYLHLREKADGVLISKTRYLLPLTGTDLTIELEVFDAPYEGLYLAGRCRDQALRRDADDHRCRDGLHARVVQCERPDGFHPLVVRMAEHAVRRADPQAGERG